MKIVAGLGCIDDYIRLVQAGADEVFCGFVPYEWNKTYGNLFPLNRREVLYYNVQINSYEDMKILKKMEEKCKVPVTITLNYLYYIEEQYELIADIMKKLIDIGFTEFIIADLSLIVYLKEKGLKCSIQLSGECSEINRLAVKFLNQFDLKRYIFHRKNTIEDMKAIINDNRDSNIEYEAFILNERCHYTGAFCSSLHCDELHHLCKVPYELCKIDVKYSNFPLVDKRMEEYYSFSVDEEDYSSDFNDDNYILGSTGCGICSLMKLKKAGVTHLKVVGRGNFIDIMEKDIKNLKKSLDILDSAHNEESFLIETKQSILEGKCSKSCYYK